jgi:hypothetical protein
VASRQAGSHLRFPSAPQGASATLVTDKRAANPAHGLPRPPARWREIGRPLWYSPQIEGVTVHGFRFAFRDWAAECTHFTNEVCEAALAHVMENKAEAAYRRADLFDKRRKLMEAWANYCDRADCVRMCDGRLDKLECPWLNDFVPWGSDISIIFFSSLRIVIKVSACWIN